MDNAGFIAVSCAQAFERPSLLIPGSNPTRPLTARRRVTHHQNAKVPSKPIDLAARDNGTKTAAPAHTQTAFQRPRPAWAVEPWPVPHRPKGHEDEESKREEEGEVELAKDAVRV